MTITEEAVFEQLSQVVDPDLPGINIVELGLIYKIEFEEIPADEIAAAKTSEPAPDAGLTIQDDHGFTAPIALDAPRDAGAAQAPDAAADAAAQTPDAAEATEAAGPSDSGATETCGDDQAGAETTRVKIEMTLTSPMCPAAPQLVAQSKQFVGQLAGVGDVEVRVVMHPPWTPEKMTEDARDKLGIF